MIKVRIQCLFVVCPHVSILQKKMHNLVLKTDILIKFGLEM